MTSRIWPEPLKEWICHNWDGKDYRSWGSQVGRDQEFMSITILLKSLWVIGRDVKQAVVYVSLKFKRELWLQACISKSSLHAWHLEPWGWIKTSKDFCFYRKNFQKIFLTISQKVAFQRSFSKYAVRMLVLAKLLRYPMICANLSSLPFSAPA